MTFNTKLTNLEVITTRETDTRIDESGTMANPNIILGRARTQLFL